MNPTDITSGTRIDNGVHRGVRFMQILATTIPDKDIPIQVYAQIMGGTPVISGTRIPVYVILELLQADYSIKEIGQLPLLNHRFRRVLQETASPSCLA